MNRIFINAQGKYYKGKEPMSPSDMERVHVTAEELKVLTDIPMSQEVLNAKLQEERNKNVRF